MSSLVILAASLFEICRKTDRHEVVKNLTPMTAVGVVNNRSNSSRFI